MPRRKEKLVFAAHLNVKIEFDCIGGLFQELGKGKFEYRFCIDPHTSSSYCFSPGQRYFLLVSTPFYAAFRCAPAARTSYLRTVLSAS